MTVEIEDENDNRPVFVDIQFPSVSESVAPETVVCLCPLEYESSDDCLTFTYRLLP